MLLLSDALEDVYTSLYHDKIPKTWSQKSYRSTKSLAEWAYDLQIRLDFIEVIITLDCFKNNLKY